MTAPLAAGQRTFTDAILDDRMAALLRTKTPAERLAMAFGMRSFARQMIRQFTVREHPEWSEAEVARHVARRLSHGAV